MYRTEMKAKTSFSWCRFFKHANWKYRYSYKYLFLWTHFDLISYGFCVFNRVANWNKGKATILVHTSFQIYHQVIEALHSIFTFLSSIWIAVSYIGNANLFCSLFKLRQNSHFCVVNIAYMLFVNTGFFYWNLLFLIQVLIEVSNAVSVILIM